jgi:hypothetical protein
MAESIAAGDNAVVENLIARGYSSLRAEILVVFVPLGLGRALISRLSVDAPMVLPETALVQEAPQGRQFEVQLADVPEFVTALELGEETFVTGIIPRAQFSASCQSVEVSLINQALDEGAKLDGAVFSPSILLRLADAPGFEEWYESLGTTLSGCAMPPNNACS